MFSVIQEWLTYLYGIFQFLGFGRSPLLEVQDKYTEPSIVPSSELNKQKLDTDRSDYCMV
jgi:hypothetical protein